MSCKNVVYVVPRFPELTQTFIYRDILELKQRGVQVKILSLLGANRLPAEPLEETLTADVIYPAPLYSWQGWRALAYFFIKKPAKFLVLWTQLLSQPYPVNFVASFLKRVAIIFKATCLAYTLKDSSVQLVHAHFADLTAVGGWLIARLLNLPFIVTPHAFDIYREQTNPFLELVVTSATRVMAISEYNRQMLLNMYPALKEEKIPLIRYGIDLIQFNPTPLKDLSVISLLAVGRLTEKKGHEYLIQACHLLKQSNINFHCTIVGEGPEEYKNKLEQLIRENNLDDEVILMGACNFSEVVAMMNSHDIFALPCVIAQNGDRDGIPNALIEAAAMQLPLISTPVSGIPELVKQGETGSVVPEKDAPALADAIRTLAANKQLRRQLGQNGRRRVEQEFNSSRNITKVLSLYDQLTGNLCINVLD